MLRSSTVVVLLASSLLFGCADADHQGFIFRPVSLPLIPAFETRLDMSTGADRHADMVLADFTGDSVPDMVVVNLSGEIELLVGQGNGTFAVIEIAAPGGSPAAVASADLDGDQDMDFVVVRTDAEVATVYLNDGTGGFSANPDLPLGSGALSLVLGDYNGDSIIDIIVARLSSPDLVIYAGTGGGGFVAAPSLSLPGGGEPVFLTMGEVSGDSLDDLVVSDRANDRILIYVGTPSGLDPSAVSLDIPGSPATVSIGDLSGDGMNDMAISAIGAGSISVVTSWSASGPTIGFTADVDGSAVNSIIADVTGDGIADLVACVPQKYRITVLSGKPGGGLHEEVQMDTYGEPLRLQVGDVNLDGDSDLVVLSGQSDRLSLFLGNAGGGLHGARNHASGLETELLGLSVGDLDGDGIADVVVGSPDSTFLSFLSAVDSEETGGVDLQQVGTLELGRFVRNVIGADLNADGKMDLIVPVEQGVKLLRNVSTPGAIEFDILPQDPTAVLTPGTGPFEVVVEDMNGDGLLDLVVVDFDAEKVFLLRATSANFTFELTALVLDVSGGPIGVATADFNGDSVADLAVSRRDFSMISIYVNDGTGVLSHAIDLPVGAAPNYLRGTDFNGDGRTDLVVSNGDGSSISVLSAQSGMSYSTVAFPAGETPTALLISDLNEDGFPDILVASLVGADFRILLGDGEGGFPELLPFAGLRGAAAASLWDMNGDQLPDLLLTSLVSTRVSLYENISTRSDR